LLRDLSAEICVYLRLRDFRFCKSQEPESLWSRR
jgi:hypothetical protein